MCQISAKQIYLTLCSHLILQRRSTSRSSRTDRVILSASDANNLHNISIPRGARQLTPLHKQSQASRSLRFPNTSRWHLHSIHRGEEMHHCSGSVGTQAKCKPFLGTLFIFRFFLLAQQAAIFLAPTEGCLVHLIRSRRQQGNEECGEVTALGDDQEEPA